MLARLRNRAKDEQGFTLIELLVVILIIGILAAVAIPTFLNQRGKAYDSNAKTVVKDMQTAAETYATGDNGAYPTTAAGVAALNGIDASIPTTGTAYTFGGATPSTQDYTVADTASDTGDVFSIVESGGTENNVCSVPATSQGGSPGGCTLTTPGGTTGTW